MAFDSKKYHREYSKAWHERQKQDTEWLEKRRAYQREYRRAKRAEDKDKVNAEWKAWRDQKKLDDPEHVQQRDRKAWKLRAYGLTLEQYEDMLEQQGGVCAICSGSSKRRQLDVDHCHITGRVRGLLCSNCNVGIGNLKDSPGLLRKALVYLES